MSAGAIGFSCRIVIVFQNAKESTLRKAIQEIGYNAYLEKYGVMARTISEMEAIDISSGTDLVHLAIAVRHQEEETINSKA